MTNKERAGLVAVSVILSILGALGIYQLIKPRDVRTSPTEDAPIIMAGGSLYIGGDMVVDTGTHTLKAKDADNGQKFKVFQIDLSDGMDNTINLPPVPAAANGNVVISYCKPAGCNVGVDTIKLHFQSGSSIEISGSFMGTDKTVRLLPNLRMHRRKHWVMKTVTVDWNGQQQGTADCTDQGECSLVVHTCLQGANCVASQ